MPQSPSLLHLGWRPVVLGEQELERVLLTLNKEKPTLDQGRLGSRK